MFEDNSLLMKFIDFVAPYSFFVRVILGYGSGVWLLISGGWKIFLGAMILMAISNLVLGLCTLLFSFVTMLLEIVFKEYIIDIVYCIETWLLALIWGYFVIKQGLFWSLKLNVNIVPVMILCISVICSPFAVQLNKSMEKRELHNLVFPNIILNIFVNLASILSVIFILFSAINIDKIILFVFSVIGIIFVIVDLLYIKEE